MPHVAAPRSLALALLLAAPMPFAATPAWAERIFISNEKGNSITVVDGDTLKVSKTVKVGARPRGHFERAFEDWLPDA